MGKREAAIVSAVRTPVGKVCGALSNLPVETLGSCVLKEVVARSGIQPECIDEVIFSNSCNKNFGVPARTFALYAGFPVSVPGFEVNRACASSLTGLFMAKLLIETGNADTVVVGGMESCTRAPWLMEKPAKGYSVAPPRFYGHHNTPPEYENLPMGLTAERVAQQMGITREECDAFALRSQQRAAAAWEEGRFDQQVLPLEVPSKKGPPAVLRQDETVRPSTMESLSRLAPSFLKDGVCTAGNSSPLTDGAAAILVMERSKADALGLEVLAVLREFASVGVQPQTMGLGPVYATRKLLERSGRKLAQFDLIEMNEAFAAQSLGCLKMIDFPDDILNVNGGAIALGHPFCATGAILTTKMVYELRRRDARLGLITFCIGGGQGFSAVLERV